MKLKSNFPITAVAVLFCSATLVSAAYAAESKSVPIQIPNISDNPSTRLELCRQTQLIAGFCGGLFTRITGCGVTPGDSERTLTCVCYCNYIGASDSYADPALSELTGGISSSNEALE